MPARVTSQGKVAGGRRERERGAEGGERDKGTERDGEVFVLILLRIRITVKDIK